MAEAGALPALGTLRIAVIGIGYVGLPVAVHLAAHFPVVAYDVDERRVNDLRAGLDRTGEFCRDDLARVQDTVTFACQTSALEAANFFIVTVPTPIDAAKRPDFSALERASETVGRVLRPGGVIVFESTVYPGATEEICVPILERASGLSFNDGFFSAVLSTQRNSSWMNSTFRARARPSRRKNGGGR